MRKTCQVASNGKLPGAVELISQEETTSLVWRVNATPVMRGSEKCFAANTAIFVAETDSVQEEILLIANKKSEIAISTFSEISLQHAAF